MAHLLNNRLLGVALFVAAGLFAVSVCDAADYYVDSVGGKDSKSGRSERSEGGFRLGQDTLRRGAGC